EKRKSEIASHSVPPGIEMESGRARCLTQAGLLEDGLDEAAGELLPLRCEVLIVADEPLLERGEVDTAFYFIDRMRHGRPELLELGVHLIDRTLQQVAEQKDAGFVAQNRAVSWHNHFCVERAKMVQGLDPLGRVAIVSKWDGRADEIPDYGDFFFG